MALGLAPRLLYLGSRHSSLSCLFTFSLRLLRLDFDATEPLLLLLDSSGMGRSTNHHVTSSSVEHDADKRKNSLDEPESESQSEEDVDELLEDEHANTSSANLAHKNAASCTESDGPKASASQDACTACHSAGRPDACVVERGSSGRRRTCKICWEKKRRCSFSGYERKVTKGKGASTGKEKKRPNAAFRDVADASSSLSAVDAKGKGKVIPTRRTFFSFMKSPDITSLNLHLCVCVNIASDEAELDAQYSTKKRKGEGMPTTTLYVVYILDIVILT